VLVDGERINACLTLAVQYEGQETRVGRLPLVDRWPQPERNTEPGRGAILPTGRNCGFRDGPRVLC
jgi:hypothetical protein